MIDKLLSFMAPHYCCGCGKIGCSLCPNCKNNIISETKIICLACNRPTGGSGLCSDCSVPYCRAWVVGERSGILEKLIDDYKFRRSKSSHVELADLLAHILPDLPDNTIIVPVPTVASHIRQRGYDHTLLIARRVARLRGLKCLQLLHRVTNTKQRQSGASQREAQAKAAFAADMIINRNCPYLLIDDIATTGATIKYASKALIKAGAKNVWVAVIARQTLG